MRAALPALALAAGAGVAVAAGTQPQRAGPAAKRAQLVAVPRRPRALIEPAGHVRAYFDGMGRLLNF